MTEKKPQRGGRRDGDKDRSSYKRKDSSSSKKSKPWTVNSDDDSSEKRDKKKESSRTSRPARKDDKPKRFTRSRDGYGEKSYEKKESSRTRKPFDKDDKPKRRYSEEDKPKRSYRSNDSYGEKAYEKKESSRTRKPFDKDDKPKRRYSEEDKPKRSYRSNDSYGEKAYEKKESSRTRKPFDKDDKPKRRFSEEDKPKRSFRSRDSYGEKAYEKKESSRTRKPFDKDDKPKRRFSEEDKPKRSYRSRDSYGEKTYEKKESSRTRKPFDKDDKPKRSYKSNERSSERFTERDDSKKRSFTGKESGFDSYKGKKENPTYISSYEPEDSRARKSRLKSSSSKQVDEPKLASETRLNKFIANSGVCSRREADTFIKAGLVSINGVIVTELGVKVMPSDEVRFNGELLHGEKKAYLLMNKPKGYVTTVEDPHADKTVMDIVKNYCDFRIYSVGRLDKNSTGVLLFTNDGELTMQLTHPSYNKKKIYQVNIDKALTKNDMQRLADGIELEDGLAYFDVIEYLNEAKTEFGIEIHSGRNRIIRRMFEHLGYKVTKLDRVYFAGLTKKNLKRGECRFLTEKEVNILKMGSYE